MYPVMNLGQEQTPVATQTQRPAPAAGVCCQATPDGGVVCSDGIIYVAGCPKAPEPNVQGVAEVKNGIPVLPTAESCAGAQQAPAAPVQTTPPAVAPSSKFPLLPVILSAVGGAGLAMGSYFIFFKK